jgi:hypothetical protein
MARMASEKMVGLRRSESAEGSARVWVWVAADSIACPYERALDQIRGEGETHHRGPDARDGHLIKALPLKVHGQTHREHAHAHLAHGVGRLPPEEAAVDGRADDHDPPAALGALEVREGGLDGCVEAVRVDRLHELEALEGGCLDGGPPYRARVVDEGVQVAIFL